MAMLKVHLLKGVTLGVRGAIHANSLDSKNYKAYKSPKPQ